MFAVLIDTNARERDDDANALAMKVGCRVRRWSDADRLPGDVSVVIRFGPEDVSIARRDPSMTHARRTFEKPFRVDLVDRGGTLLPRHVVRRQAIARAAGPSPAHVVDATAGFGADACALAQLGHRVTALERHPVVAALLRDGVDRAIRAGGFAPDGRSPWTPIEVIETDATEWCRGRTPQTGIPDVIHLDPMFPPRRKSSAAVRKSAEILRFLAGTGTTDDDAARSLFGAVASMYTAAAETHEQRGRVILKRPPEAPLLAGPPTYSARGKLIRYDVYAAADLSRPS